MPLNERKDHNYLSTDNNETPQIQYCSLEYREQRWGSASARFRPVVLLVFKETEGNLRFLVHPELRSIIQKEDLPYTESLLIDFLERSKQEPDALFKQLSSLGVGTLVTQDVGMDLDTNDGIRELSARFIELK